MPFHQHKVAQLIEDVVERYGLGWDPFRIEALWRIVYSSRYTQHPNLSVEMACWDIVGKALDQPIYNLFSGRIHEKFRSYTYLYPAPESETKDVL